MWPLFPCDTTYDIPHDGHGDPPLPIEPIRETTPEMLIHDCLELDALGFSGLRRRQQRRERDQVVGTGGVRPYVFVNVESYLLMCVINHNTLHLSRRR